MGKGLQIQSHT